MAEPDVAQGSIVQVEKGNFYEVWRSPTITLRLDWNRSGAVLHTVWGHGCADSATVITRRWEALRRAHAKITILADFCCLPTYDSAFRVIEQEWIIKNRASLEPIHVLVSSKIVAMGVAVANLAMGGLMTSYSTRASFDSVVAKHGLPANPTMPK